MASSKDYVSYVLDQHISVIGGLSFQSEQKPCEQ